MRNSDKPFVVYRRGPGSFTIVPRGAKGWAQLGGWLVLLAGLVGWFVMHAEAYRDQPEFVHGLVLFCAGLIAWTVCAIWWMLSRGEVVEVAELIRQKQYERRKQRRSK